MGNGQGALGPTGSNEPVMDDIADNNKDSIYQIAESKARQNGANDAHYGNTGYGVFNGGIQN